MGLTVYLYILNITCHQSLSQFLVASCSANSPNLTYSNQTFFNSSFIIFTFAEEMVKSESCSMSDSTPSQDNGVSGMTSNLISIFTNLITLMITDIAIHANNWKTFKTLHAIHIVEIVVYGNPRRFFIFFYILYLLFF